MSAAPHPIASLLERATRAAQRVDLKELGAAVADLEATLTAGGLAGLKRDDLVKVRAAALALRQTCACLSDATADVAAGSTGSTGRYGPGGRASEERSLFLRGYG